MVFVQSFFLHSRKFFIGNPSFHFLVKNKCRSFCGGNVKRLEDEGVETIPGIVTEFKLKYLFLFCIGVDVFEEQFIILGPPFRLFDSKLITVIPLGNICVDSFLKPLDGLSQLFRVLADLVTENVQELDVVLILIAFDHSIFDDWNLLHSNIEENIFFSENLEQKISVMRDGFSTKRNDVPIGPFLFVKGAFGNEIALGNEEHECQNIQNLVLLIRYHSAGKFIVEANWPQRTLEDVPRFVDYFFIANSVEVDVKAGQLLEGSIELIEFMILMVRLNIISHDLDSAGHNFIPTESMADKNFGKKLEP